MIVFENPGEIDIRFIKTFGLSIKEGENPIGFFGTGLKYAIAVLLRNNQQIQIASGEAVYTFFSHEETIRGKEAEFVKAESPRDGYVIDLGFTLHLGANWPLWAAYRELACNCKDEGGSISEVEDSSPPMGEPGKTRILVRGDAFEKIYRDRQQYILDETKPSIKTNYCNIYNSGCSSLYYKDVRAMELEIPSLFKYNITAGLELTEDRTIKSIYLALSQISDGWKTSTDRGMIKRMLLARPGTLEQKLTFNPWGADPSQEFMEVVEGLIADNVIYLNSSARTYWEGKSGRRSEPKIASMSMVEKKTLARAMEFCNKIGYDVQIYPIKIVESLGSGGLGMAVNETIYVAHKAFEMGGAKRVAATLIEEYIHLQKGYYDCTREMQNYLFEKVVSMGEELLGEPV